MMFSVEWRESDAGRDTPTRSKAGSSTNRNKDTAATATATATATTRGRAASSAPARVRSSSQESLQRSVPHNPALAAFHRRRGKKAKHLHESQGAARLPLSYWVVGRLLPLQTHGRKSSSSPSPQAWKERVQQLLRHDSSSSTEGTAPLHASTSAAPRVPLAAEDPADVRELYVCFQDGAGQDLSEIAFKLFSGL